MAARGWSPGGSVVDGIRRIPAEVLGAGGLDRDRWIYMYIYIYIMCVFIICVYIYVCIH